MRSGFFNSTITGYDEEGMPIFDRAEDATFFAKYFSRIVGNGIFADPGDGMMVQASNGMNLTVKSGVCFINGYMGWLESDEMITVDAAHAILDRIDMIVARYDGVNREINIHYIKGTESSAPVPPEIERTETGGSDIYDLALAQVYVSKRTTTITQASITDLRLNDDVCGIVTSPIEHLDTSEVNAQLTAAFNEWFEEIKGQLSEDAAGNLQLQIDSQEQVLNSHTSNATIHITSEEREKWNRGVQEDYIVEEGISGIWQYRKWESGLAECWGNSSQTIDIDNIWDAAGNLVFGTGQPVLYPFTFTEMPSCMITQQNYDGLTIQVIRASGTTTQTPTPGLVKTAPIKGGYEMIFAFEAKGKYR